MACGGFIPPHATLIMNEIITRDNSDISHKTWDVLERMSRNEQMADKVLTQTRLDKVKAASDACYQSAMDGIGECYAQMDSETYHRQLQNDPDFWKCESNTKKFFKQNTQYLNAGYKI